MLNREKSQELVDAIGTVASRLQQAHVGQHLKGFRCASNRRADGLPTKHAGPEEGQSPKCLGVWTG